MSDKESFLARWSRRKHGAGAARQEEANAAEDAGPAAPPPAAGEPIPAEAAPPDPATLPPVESIGPGSDVRAFLQAGVPADLTRAALRRAWSADPDIRDFVGLAENSWDFNAPDGMGGFGRMTADEARRLFDHLTEGPAGPGSAPMPATGPETAEATPPAKDAAGVTPDQDGPRSGEESAAQELIIPHGDTKNTAVQQNRANSEYEPVLVPRGHGGAAPK